MSFVTVPSPVCFTVLVVDDPAVDGTQPNGSPVADGARALLQLMRDGRPRTRSELATMTGLARSTVTQRVDALLASGLIGPADAWDAAMRFLTSRGALRPAELLPTLPPGKAEELMMSCAVCGVHLPASDAVFARGRVYCGPEHRDADLDGLTRDRDAAAGGDRG